MVVGKKTVRLQPGQGAQDPADALKVPTAPGKIVVRLTSEGKTTDEEFQVGADTVWGGNCDPRRGSICRRIVLGSVASPRARV